MTTFEQRIVKSPSGCWIWQGGKTARGYGMVEHTYVHRWSYETFVGPIPEGLELDHLCRRRDCANPTHLEPVTRAENQRRGNSPSGVNHRRTECVNGHPFDEGNTYYRKDRLGRVCKACRAARMRTYEGRPATSRSCPGGTAEAGVEVTSEPSSEGASA